MCNNNKIDATFRVRVPGLGNFASPPSYHVAKGSRSDYSRET